MAYVHSENHATNLPISSDRGERSPVIQEIFRTKSDTSTVARVRHLLRGAPPPRIPVSGEGYSGACASTSTTGFEPFARAPLYLKRQTN